MRSLYTVLAIATSWPASLSAATATATATIAISASVLPVCTVSGGAIAFGAYAPSTAIAREGAVTLTCSEGVSYAVALDEGVQGDGTTRRMARGDGATLAYDLYRDAGHHQRWGSGGSAATGTGSGGTQTLPVYAAIAPSAALAGNYTDSVTILVTY